MHASSGRRELLERYPWITFLVPLAVFLLAGTLEPLPPGASAARIAPWSVAYSAYPWIYTAKIALTMAALAAVWPGVRVFPVRVTLLGIAVGLVGVAVWIGLAELGLEQRLLRAAALEAWLPGATRSAFNPLEQLGHHPAWAWTLLGIRLFGLVVVIAIAEELFLRGLLMRFFVAREWWKVPIGQINRGTVLAGTLVPMLMHPGELLAAAAWFSLVTWLMVKTRSLWDCIAAHALTTLILGIYVLTTGHWWLL